MIGPAFLCIMLWVMGPAAPLQAAPPDPSSQVTPAGKGQPPASTVGDPLAGALERLMAEARDLGTYKDHRMQPHFSRPHPALASLGPQDPLNVLRRMVEPLEGNAYELTYVRWHLIELVLQSEPNKRRQAGPLLLQLVRRMPGPLELSELSEWHHAPADVAQRYHEIYNSLRVVTGYPPYQRRISPPESLALMNTRSRQAAERLWQDAVKLRKQFTTIRDDQAVAYNRRLRQINFVVRQYRGELIYAMLFTGDPKMASLIAATVHEQASKSGGIALDLLSFWYMAALDGAMAMYEPALLKQLGQQLEQTARAHDRWFHYEHRQRNLADYAFHLVRTLKEGSGFLPDRPQPATVADDRSTRSTE